MSVTTYPPIAVPDRSDAPDARSAAEGSGGVRDALRFGFGLLARVAIGIVLCASYLGGLVVVGWTFRLMRRQILRGWWKRSPMRAAVPFATFLAGHDRELPPGILPRWVVGERMKETIHRPGPDGRPPSRFRQAVRAPAAALAALGWNLRVGVRALACTVLLTLPGCFLWLASWEFGWVNSFHKGYEQSAVGPLTGLLGIALFILAMVYLPMAWAHLAATGDPRAFFQFGFVTRLIRQKVMASALFAAVFSLVMLPLSILRVLPYYFTHINPALEEATPEQIRRVVVTYNLGTAVAVFLGFVTLHLLAARMYRSAVPKLLRRRPELVDDLHPALARDLDALALLPDGPAHRRHPLLAVALGTGRQGVHILMWALVLFLWFTVAAQVYIVQFLHYQPIIGWLNQPMIHVPSLAIARAVAG